MRERNRALEARAYFLEGFNCAQSVFAAFSQEMNMTPEQCLKIASAFGGGMGMQSTCGAVTGALMVIGGLKGYTSSTDNDKKQQHKLLSRLFLERFARENDGLTCRELVGYDFAAKESIDPVLKKKANEDICPSLVESAVRFVEELTGITKSIQ